MRLLIRRVEGRWTNEPRYEAVEQRGSYGHILYASCGADAHGHMSRWLAEFVETMNIRKDQIEYQYYMPGAGAARPVEGTFWSRPDFDEVVKRIGHRKLSQLNARFYREHRKGGRRGKTA